MIFLPELFTLIQNESFCWLPKRSIWSLVGEGVIDTTLSLKICPIVWKSRGSCCLSWVMLQGLSDSVWVCPGHSEFGFPGCPRSEQVSRSSSSLWQRSLGCPLDDGAVPQTLCVCWERLFHGVISPHPPWRRPGSAEGWAKIITFTPLKVLASF